MKRFVTISLATISLALLGVLGLFAPAWANNEMHLGSRLFYPLWDVSNGRVTFIIVTRMALNDRNAIRASTDPTLPQTVTRWRTPNTDDNCRPKGNGGSERNVNRTLLGGTGADPVFVDDFHVQYYGKNCDANNETIHLSCADIDLLFLSQTGPRKGFSSVAAQGQGAVEIHGIVNDNGVFNQREDENALMGHAVIVDIAEGWAATYPAAAAKVIECSGSDNTDPSPSFCAGVDGGTNLGYEPFPQEVYLPFAFADHFTNPAPLGNYTNLLSLWAPGFMPGSSVGPVNLDIRWWDGRERIHTASSQRHALVDTLSNISTEFDVTNFVCGHAGNASIAENDGFPRSGAQPCGPPGPADPTHKSDNFEIGSQLQSSTPIGWWRFNRIPSGGPPVGGLPSLGTGGTAAPPQFDGKGLVGVNLSSAAAVGGDPGIGDAVRLWHKDPCEETTHGFLKGFGPPHLRDIAASQTLELVEGPDTIVFFNVWSAGTPGLENGSQLICNVELFSY